MRVVAPSGPIDADVLARGLAVLRGELRLEVVIREDVTARDGFLAGDDARRLEEWRDAVADPDARAIFLARGGYGAMRLLPGIDAGWLAERPKWLVGFSDATVLHAAANLAGVVTLHGPTVSTLPRASAAARAHLVRLLTGGPSAVPGCEGTGVIHPGRASGPLVGGCLALLGHLCGTPWFPRVRGGVLFFEDVNEKPYELDRLLTQLRLGGALDGVRAVCVGQLTGCDDDGVSGLDTVRAFVRSLGVPAIEGIPAGHLDDNHALPLGATVTVVAPARGEPGAPRLLFTGDAGA